MSELPKDWVTTHLDNVAIVQGGYAFKSKDFQSTGTPVLRISNIAGLNDGLDNSCARINPTKLAGLERFQLAKGDIVVAMSGATTGKFGVFNLNETVFLNQRVGRINTKNSATLDQRYLFHYFGLLQKRILDAAYGAAQPNISPKEIAEFEIPLPPLPEQRRIVARIEELFSHLDAGVAALRHAKAQLQRYRQSVLAAAVTGQLTQEWREQHPDTEPAEVLLKRILKQRRAQWNGRGKYKEPVSIELNDEGPQPATWTTTNLDSATTMLGDGLHGTPEYDPEGEFYFINGNNLSNGRIIFKDSTKRVSESEYRKHSKPLTENSIFVSINGTLGNTAFYSGEKVILGKSACFFNLSSALNKHYVRTVLQTTRFLNYLHKTATGSTIKNVPLQAMRNFSFGIPPLAEQHQIVAEVEARTTAIDHLEAELDRQITRARRLRQSTLQFAFEGRIL